MKIQLKINNKPFKETTIFKILYVILLTVRILFVVAILLIPTIICWVVFPLLGVKNVIYKILDLYEGLSFLGDKP
jgi:hypothetical protein